MKLLLTLMAAVEAATGVALLASPVLVVQILLGTEIAGAAVPLGRIGGAGLLALGVACWAARGASPRSGLPTALLYNAAEVLILAPAGLQFPTAGVVLWLAVVGHAAMTVWCVALIARKPN